MYPLRQREAWYRFAGEVREGRHLHLLNSVGRDLVEFVERAIAIAGEPTMEMDDPDGKRVSIGWQRYQTLVADSERLNALERWALTKEPATLHHPVEIIRTSTGSLGLLLGGETLVVMPTLREAVDAQVRAE